MSPGLSHFCCQHFACCWCLFLYSWGAREIFMVFRVFVSHLWVWRGCYKCVVSVVWSGHAVRPDVCGFGSISHNFPFTRSFH